MTRWGVLGLVLGLFLAGVAFGAPRPEKLPWAVDAAGKPAVGLIYSYDVDWGWTFTYTSTLSSEKIAALPAVLYWAFFGADGRRITQWHAVPRQVARMGQLSTSSRFEVEWILPRMKGGYVVLAAHNGGQPLYTLDTGEVCARFPAHVKDLTTTAAPACEPALAD